MVAYGRKANPVPVTPSWLEITLFFIQFHSYSWLLAIIMPLARDMRYNSGS